MAAKKKKKKVVRKPKNCAVCREFPQFIGELCMSCDESYEWWLGKKKGSSLSWAAARARDIALGKVYNALEAIAGATK